MNVGDLVVYVPSHVDNLFHDECEVGIIKSIQSEANVFVNYWRNEQLQQTAQRTSVSDLKPFPFQIGDIRTRVNQNAEFEVIDIKGEMVSCYDTVFNSVINYRGIRITRKSKIDKILEI